MQAIKAVLRQKWFWVCQNKPFWVSVFLLAVTLACIFIKPAQVNRSITDLPVRFWGMCLQLFGAYTVWVDITKTAKDFGEGPSFWKTWDYLKSFFRKPREVTGSLKVTLAGANCSATGRLSSSFDRNQPLDVRTSHLERFVQNLDSEIAGIHTQIANQSNELSNEINRKTGELQNSIEGVRHQLKDALVGNYAVLRLGALWLVVGIVVSSVDVEITNLVHLHQLPRLW